MKGKIVIIVLLLIIFSAAIIAALYFFGSPGQQNQPPQPPNNQQPTDQTNKPQKPQPPSPSLQTGDVEIQAGDHTFTATIFVPQNWNKACVILVHGLGSNKNKWVKESVVKDLLSNSYCVLIFDLPLHGDRGRMKSLAQLPYVIEVGAKDVESAASYLKSHGASEVYLISRSLGSIVSAVALGNGASIEKAELLLASANFTYLYEHGAISSDPKGRAEMGKWINDQDVLKKIDPLYKLPLYTGAIHFHCGKKDNILPPETCQLAYDISTSASERKLFWHDTGHSMSKDLFIDEALDFFGKTVPSPGGTSGTIKWTTHPTPSKVEEGEPPIHVLFVLHIEPKLDKNGEMYLGSDIVNKEYSDVSNELEWLLDFCDRTGVKMTALFNGWFMQVAVEKNDLGILERLLTSGHEIGTHAHDICYDQSSRKWFRCNDPEGWFADAKKAIDIALSKIGIGKNRVMCAMFQRGQYSQECQLMDKYGYDIGLGNRPEIALNFFGHIVWNPWRANCVDNYDLSLKEDFSSPFVSIDHRAQIGSTTSHGGVDSRSVTLKRQFLLVFLEWKIREVYGFEDKVWSWGVVHHPNYGARYHSDIEDFFGWLNKYFIGFRTQKGNIVAVYSTASEVADEYYNWEKNHPGSSSFSYVAGGNYPYLTEFAKDMLLECEYQGESFFTKDTLGFIFRNKKGEYVIVLWNRGKGSDNVDLSSYFTGKVKVCAPWGSCIERSANDIVLGEVPVIVLEG